MHDYYNDIIEKFISLIFKESLKFTVGSDVNDDSSFSFILWIKRQQREKKLFSHRNSKEFLLLYKEYDDRCRDNITYNYSFHKSVDGMDVTIEIREWIQSITFILTKIFFLHLNCWK